MNDKKEKFANVQDALDYINSRLVLKGFIKSNESLHFDKDVDIANTKLIINTFNKVLKSLENKNTQLYELQSELKKQRDSTKIVPKVSQSPPPPPPSSRIITKPVKVVKLHHQKLDKLSNVTRTYKVNLNRLQSTIDELRSQIQSERNRKLASKDLTWQIHQDITTHNPTTPNPSEIIKEYQDQLSSLLKSQTTQQKLQSHLLKFLDNVNRYTYSTSILGIPDMELKQQDPDDFKQFHNDELLELINDWYEIVKLSRQSAVNNNNNNTSSTPPYQTT